MIKKYHTKSVHNVVTTKGQAHHCVLIKHNTRIEFCKQLSFVDNTNMTLIRKNDIKFGLNRILFKPVKSLWDC